jgi:spore germination protein KA
MEKLTIICSLLKLKGEFTMSIKDLSKIELRNSLDENIKMLKDILKNDTTIIYREIVTRTKVRTNTNQNTNANAKEQTDEHAHAHAQIHSQSQSQTKDYMKCILVYIDGMTNNQFISQNIIKPLLLMEISCAPSNGIIDLLMSQVLFTGDNKKVTNVEEIISGIIYGNAVLFIDGCNEAIFINTIGWEKRSISEPQAETIVRGPREGFTESMTLNLSLLRRRVVNPDLKFEFTEIGKQTKTKICICYIQGIAQQKILKELYQRLNKIDIDGILDSGYIEEMIKDAPYSPFRTITNTERPDVVIGKLLEGRFAVICDGSPVVLTLPSIFAELFQSNEDYYDNFLYSSLIRLLRWLCFFLGTSVPAIYLSLVNFHQEVIPTPLLLSIYSARKGVPFPTIVESIGMIMIFEILKEAGLRMPKYIGQAISIVGALVLGDAAVNAKLVSAPIVITTAITGIASIMLPQALGILEIRMILLVMSSFLGLYGYIFGVMGVVLHMMSIRSFGIPYMLDVPAFSAQDIKDTAIRAPLWNMRLRPKLFSKKVKRMNKS